jgi:hypothetical protein
VVWHVTVLYVGVLSIYKVSINLNSVFVQREPSRKKPAHSIPMSLPVVFLLDILGYKKRTFP